MKQQKKMKKSGTKKKNAQDLTLRNLRALKKRVEILEFNLTHLRGGCMKLENRLMALENASKHKTKRR